MKTYLDYISLYAISAEDPSAACQSNSSLFLLVRNSGIIWHPEGDQCVHTTLVIESSYT